MRRAFKPFSVAAAFAAVLMLSGCGSIVVPYSVSNASTSIASSDSSSDVASSSVVEDPEDTDPDEIDWVPSDNGDGTVTITGYNIDGKELSGEISIPSKVYGKTVKIIGERVFYGNNQITVVNIPSTVETIEEYAFASCKNLRTVTAESTPESGLRQIDTHAFADCTSLKNVSLPKTLRRIRDHAFANCTSLEMFVIPANNEKVTLEAKAFTDCKALKKIFVPLSVESVSGVFDEDAKIEDVYYEGSEAEWNEIKKSSGSVFANAKVHENSSEADIYLEEEENSASSGTSTSNSSSENSSTSASSSDSGSGTSSSSSTAESSSSSTSSSESESSASSSGNTASESSGSSSSGSDSDSASSSSSSHSSESSSSASSSSISESSSIPSSSSSAASSEATEPERGTPESYKQGILYNINKYRVARGLDTLKMGSEHLNEAAQRRAKELSKEFGYNRPGDDGVEGTDILNEYSDIEYLNMDECSTGEAIARTSFTAPEHVVDAWMGVDPSEDAGWGAVQAHIINKNYAAVGIGYYEAEDGKVYWDVLFVGIGAPSSASDSTELPDEN